MTNSATAERKPSLRFPEFADLEGWTYQRLGELAERQTRRNTDRALARVLTNSAEHGVVDQKDFFDREIVTSENLDAYFVVEEGDYVYNPRISKIAPVGPISRNRVGLGIMSPLYTVFRFREDDHGFYDLYFQSSHWHKFLRDASNTGARHDRMSISTEDFFNMPVPVPPSTDEMAKIIAFAENLDRLIDAAAEKLDRLSAYRRGLLQQIFPRPEGE